MKIAIIGYGRMGRLIERIALERGHEVVCRIDTGETDRFDSAEFRQADVAIEFSVPSAVVKNLERCFGAGVPVVCGTTGWLSELPRLRELCESGKGTLLYGSNFSIGVNIFFALNRWLSRVMERFPQYSPSVEETHHIHKLDHPSGTAVTLAEDLVETNSNVMCWREPDNGRPFESGELPVSHVRRGEVAGIHTVTWDSPYDTISVTHSARSREGFATGAVTAAEWLIGKKGFFTVGDMLDIK